MEIKQPARGTAYVCGFAFTHDQRVVLIRKARPEWQRGLLNGVGGRIEEARGEVSTDAMVREFFEETGVAVYHDDWVKFHVERWPNGNSVHFFTCQLRPDQHPRTMTDESIETVLWDWRSRLNEGWDGFMYNLCYLVPMAFCHLIGDPANIPAHAA